MRNSPNSGYFGAICVLSRKKQEIFEKFFDQKISTVKKHKKSLQMQAKTTKTSFEVSADVFSFNDKIAALQRLK